MAAIHQTRVKSSLLKTKTISPQFDEEVFLSVDESLSYEIEVAAGVVDQDLPGLGSGAGDIATITSFILHTDTAITLNMNAADFTLSAGSMVALSNISTTTVPHVTNAGATTATVSVLASGT